MIGFHATAADGRVFQESAALTWDDVPRGVPLVRVALVDDGEPLATIEDCERFFFSREGVSVLHVDGDGEISGQTDQLVALLLGCVTGPNASELRLDVSGSVPRLSARHVPLAELDLAESTFRPGVL